MLGDMTLTLTSLSCVIHVSVSLYFYMQLWLSKPRANFSDPISVSISNIPLLRLVDTGYILVVT
jgi:hypothetical protein